MIGLQCSTQENLKGYRRSVHAFGVDASVDIPLMMMVEVHCFTLKMFIYNAMTMIHC